MGGTAASPDAIRRTDKQHIAVALAGPLSQLMLLGLPSLAGLLCYGPYGYSGLILRVMVYTNIGWALVNLSPIYPSDGGQVFYRFLLHRDTKDPWQIALAVSFGTGALLGMAAYYFGYLIGALLIVYILIRGAIAGPPGGGSSSISTAAAQARADHIRHNIKGAGREATLTEAYGCLVDESMFRLDTLKGQLERGKHYDDLAILNSWEALLQDLSVFEVDPKNSSPLLVATALAIKNDPESGISPALRKALESPELLPAMSVLLQASKLESTLSSVDDQSLEQIRNSLIDAGRLEEQMAVGRVLRLHRETRMES